jgi:hypothetical protein
MPAHQRLLPAAKEVPAKWPMIVLVAFQAALSVYAIVAVVLVD